MWPRSIGSIEIPSFTQELSIQRKGIGEMTIRRDRLEEILLTAGALNNLYDKLFVLRTELMALISFFEVMEDWRARLPDGTVIAQLATQNYHSRMTAMDEGKYGILLPDDQPDRSARTSTCNRQRSIHSPSAPAAISSAASIISGVTPNS